MLPTLLPKLSPTSSVLAPEEFDRLLFEFGLELDEDVRIYFFATYHQFLRAMIRLQRKLKRLGNRVCLQNDR